MAVPTDATSNSLHILSGGLLISPPSGADTSSQDYHRHHLFNPALVSSNLNSRSSERDSEPRCTTFVAENTNNLKSSKLSKQRPSAVRAQQAKSIINATYKVCTGKTLDPQARASAKPVFQFDRYSFLVPANRSEYCALRNLQSRTQASRVNARFRKRVVLPGHLGPTSAIVITMPSSPHEILKGSVEGILGPLTISNWESDGEAVEFIDSGSTIRKLKFKSKDVFKEPDASIWVPRARLPFLVVEVAVAETEKKLAYDGHQWCQGSRGHVKIICLIKLVWTDKKSNRFQVFVTIHKPQQVRTGTLENDGRFRVVPNCVLDRIEVYPRQPTETFDIFLKDVLPKYTNPASNHSEHYVTIPLIIFHVKALQAYSVLKNAPPNEGSSPFNGDQEEVPSPESSADEMETEYEISEEEFDSDSDFDDNCS